MSQDTIKSRNDLSLNGQMQSSGFNPDVLKEYQLTVFEGEQVGDCWRLQTDRGPKAFYKFHGKIERIKVVHQYLENLAKKGFRRTSRFIPTRDGSSCVVVERDAYAISDWLPGRHASFQQDSDVLKAAANLAQMHDLSRGCGHWEKIQTNQWFDYLKKQTEDLLKYTNLAKNNVNKSQFDELFLSHATYFYSEAQFSLKIMEQAHIEDLIVEAAREGTLCHGNWGEKQLLATRGSRLGVLGWEGAFVGASVLDISRFFTKVSICKNWLSGNILSDALNQYLKHKELSKQEIEIIWGLMMYPRKFWLYSSRYYLRPRSWDIAALKKALEQTIEEEERRQNAIAMFKDSI